MSKFSMAFLGTAAMLALVVGGIAMYWMQPSRALALRESSWHAKIEPGDVVLQQLNCGLRCDFISSITKSKYTNVGLVLDQHGKRVVWDAFGNVDYTPLGSWIQQGKKERIAVYRPDAAIRAKLPALTTAMQALRGTPYDPDFEWSDSAMYSAELVAKVFARAGVPVVTARPLGKGGFGSHAHAVFGLTQGKLTVQTPIVMPIDFVRSPKLHKVVDELAGSP